MNAMEDFHAFTKQFLHDLRSPLGVIMLNASWFATHAGKEQGPTFLKSNDAIIEQARYMLDLIEKADRIYTLHSGSIEVQPACFDLVEYSREVLEEFAARQEREVQFHPACHELVITTDPIRYREALIDLLDNIVTFSKSSDPIEAHIAKVNGGEAAITIIDPWVGVPREKQDLIFTPFNRVQISPDTPDSGNGLGMYLTKLIIEDLLKGKITLDISSTSESRYEIRLPAKNPGECVSH